MRDLALDHFDEQLGVKEAAGHSLLHEAHNDGFRVGDILVVPPRDNTPQLLYEFVGQGLLLRPSVAVPRLPLTPRCQVVDVAFSRHVPIHCSIHCFQWIYFEGGMEWH